MGKLTETQKAAARGNQTWYINDEIINNAFIELNKSLGRRPKTTEMMAKTGFTRDTIDDHLAQLKLVDYTDKYKLQTEQVLDVLYNNATVKEDNQAIKLWLQVVHKFGENNISVANTGNGNFTINIIAATDKPKEVSSDECEVIE